jgi:hypothetical protein
MSATHSGVGSPRDANRSHFRDIVRLRDDRASRAAHGSAGASLAARGAMRRAMPRADAKDPRRHSMTRDDR